MADKAWKRFERRVAKVVGGERVPVSGRQRGSTPDIEHNWLSIECKYRKSVPEWVKDAMRQAVASQQSRQLPCVIIGEHGQRAEDALIVFRLGDARDWWIK
jgi:hypothetical protein